MLLGTLGAFAVEIGFGEHESGTIITDQYGHQGLVFDGVLGGGPPVIHDYGGDFGRVLVSHDWHESIVIRFVEPTDFEVFRPISYFEFNNKISVETDVILVRLFDAEDNNIFSTLSYSPSLVQVWYASNTIAYAILEDYQGSSYVVDDLVFLYDGDQPAVRASSWSAIKTLY